VVRNIPSVELKAEATEPRKGTREKLRALQEGRLSAEENVLAALDSINRHNKEVNAILFMDAEALQQARTIDKKRKAGDNLGRLAVSQSR
jgi:Asp-tRNA(Asn)/Glu-tRNA(Gln) amidotransferase A subunit family amidase